MTRSFVREHTLNTALPRAKNQLSSRMLGGRSDSFFLAHIGSIRIRN